MKNEKHFIYQSSLGRLLILGGFQFQENKKINALITEITRTPFKGAGQPEPLKHQLSGYWSRRIDNENSCVLY